MTLVDKTVREQSDAISFELDLKHSPAKVWRALTEPALLAQWLLPAFDFKLEPGAAFKFKTDPVQGWDGIVNATMLEVEPQHKLRYAWVVGDIDTVMTFTLTPTASGTQLSIVQSGFKAHQKQNFGGARYGWKMMGEKLIELLPRLP
jgi:uncharacterized protein YndB with AHSA1/START domain